MRLILCYYFDTAHLLYGDCIKGARSSYFELFGHVLSYLLIEGNLKITVYQATKTLKR